VITLSTLVKLPVQIVESAASIVGIRVGTEEPRYRVVDRIGDVEVREYGARIAAETTVTADDEEARSIGFRRLAHYIFGGNRTRTSIAMTAPVAQSTDSQQIAMTAPVAQSTDGGTSIIRFFMPSEFDLDSLPEPTSDTVRLVSVDSETVAVLRFSGDRGPAAVARQQSALLDAVGRSTYRAVGEPVAWFYDPPWTLPFRRRNEIAVPVSAR
jgi:hypothetical protein